MKNNITNQYQLPPEWFPQSGVMVTWPHQDTIWADTLDDIDNVYVEIAKQITLREKLIIVCFDFTHQNHIQALLTKHGVNLKQIMNFIAPSDDIWARDHGPLIVFDENKPIILDFIFNGWGNKYPSQNDNNIVRLLHSQNAFGDIPLHKLNMVLEGGSIEVDGKGTLLTTRSCLLANTRNPNLSSDTITKSLQQLFGIKKILWLDHGYLAGDDTDGHIDTLARFVDPHSICYVSCDDPNDQHFVVLKEMENQLRTFKDYQDNPYRLIPLPLPKARYATFDGRRLPATYANFLIINEAILVPTYQDANDAKALQILGQSFPNRQIIGINCLPLIQWYGSLHCMTMQLPQGVIT